MLKKTAMNSSNASAIKKGQQVPLYGVCGFHGHYTDSCPILQDDSGIEAVNVMNDHNTQSWRKYDPYSNTYNSGWHHHPNPRYVVNQQ